jgi:FrmR/RcnR family transcriptional regulator, repressor of rcnA expression
LYCEKGPLFGGDITERLQVTAQSDSFSDCSERRLRAEDACPITLARGSDPGADRDQEVFVFRACFAYNLGVARPYRTGLGLDTIPLLGSQYNKMSHMSREKLDLVNRTKKVIGQLEAILRALNDDEQCADVLQRLAAARGSINSLMGELMEDHIRNHMPRNSKSSEEAADDLIGIVRTYLK